MTSRYGSRLNLFPGYYILKLNLGNKVIYIKVSTKQ
ncbi:hypothetical protein BAZSYMA_ACONTIG249783_0 [Bathymodiolus azoricus thioautotrophic gill symbiont]|uniref:Uncharacterized protein n=1 Tax=Bathymodiolus azoricus thioautotrophic gill symbiont TaxID=235205 RepID=A0A1H6LS39_9GAMM|nr:hypothetical protein BAZSYMA_ACONTIG249783_0 [Bathymodiolus azoricus thioautotrophic gill symbiont]